MTSSILPRRTFSGVHARGPLVLVIAEEDSLRELYAAELAAAGFMVLEAGDGVTAIEKAMQFGPHAVVLELELKAFDGLKVARRLRTDDRTQDVPIVSLTGSSWKFGTLALGAGCDSVLRKPVIASVLIGELVRLIARRAERPSHLVSMPLDGQEDVAKVKF